MSKTSMFAKSLQARITEMVNASMSIDEMMREIKSSIRWPDPPTIVLVEVLPPSSWCRASVPTVFFSIDRRRAGQFVIFGD